MNTYDKIKNALEKAQEKPYNNGMATDEVSISTIDGNIDIIRKCGSLKKPEIFLFILKPNEEMGHIEPNNSNIKGYLELMTNLKHTDLNVVIKSRYGYENQYTCIIPVSLF